MPNSCQENYLLELLELDCSYQKQEETQIQKAAYFGQIRKNSSSVMLSGVRLPDGHLVRIPHGAEER